MAINLRPDQSPHRPSDEETPLLAELPGDQPPKNYVQDHESTGESGGEQTVIIEEPSNKRLVIVMGSIWVGVFLGALGKS